MGTNRTSGNIGLSLSGVNRTTYGNDTIRTSSNRSWAAYWAGLTRNTDEVEVSGRTTITTTGNLGGGSTSRYYLNNLHSERIRQNGNVTKVQFWFGTLNNVTGIIFQIWRYDGSAWDLVGEEDVFSKVTASQTNLITLTTPIAAQEGDFTAIGIISTTSVTQRLAGVDKNIEKTANNIIATLF